MQHGDSPVLRLRLAERWNRLGPAGAGILVLLMLSAISLAGWWVAFEPARDPAGCVTLAARGMRGIRSCEPNDIGLQIFFGLAIGSLFGFLALRLLWQVGREFCRPLPEEPLADLLKGRLEATRDRLVQAEGIPAERLTVTLPSADAAAAAASGEGRVEFGLGAADE